MDTTRIAERLIARSQACYSPLPQIRAWPEAFESGQWFMPWELMAISKTHWATDLDENARLRLSFFELINFFSLNIHGETAMLGPLAAHRLAVDRLPAAEYLHHFIDEENKHLHYFTTFCLRYAGKVYPDKKLALTSTCSPDEESLLFFAKVLIFEKIVAHFNTTIADDVRVCPLIRDINRMHQEDEVRHLAYGRLAVEALYERCRRSWSEERQAEIVGYLDRYLESTIREYVNPAVYLDAELIPGAESRLRRANDLARSVYEQATAWRASATRRAREAMRDIFGAFP